MWEKGREPEEDRVITFAIDGKLYDLPLVSFVIVQTARYLQARDEDVTPETVAPLTGQIAKALSVDGWFTADEYFTAWAASEAEDADDELREIMGGMQG